MPKYVALLSFTGEGMSNIKQSAERVGAAQEAVEKVGGTWIGYYVTRDATMASPSSTSPAMSWPPPSSSQ